MHLSGLERVGMIHIAFSCMGSFAGWLPVVRLSCSRVSIVSFTLSLTVFDSAALAHPPVEVWVEHQHL